MSKDDREIDTGASFRSEGGRMTLVEMLYHQQGTEQPKCHESRFMRRTHVEEQLFERALKVGEEWTAITSWVSKAAMMVVENREGRNLQVQPSDQDRENTKRKVVQISVGTGSFLVRPGETFRGEPEDVSQVRLRCMSGEARVLVVLVPGD